MNLRFLSVNLDEEITEHTQALEINPDDDESYFKRGLHYKHNGVTDKVIANKELVQDLLSGMI